MKEIKFRAWDVENKCWLGTHDYLVSPNGKGAVDWGDEIYWKFTREIILSQYTGLKDKNGVEGYSGSILGGLLGGVFFDWCNKCCQITGYIVGDFCLQCDGDVNWVEIVESINDGTSWFIGNIYENPELLNES